MATSDGFTVWISDSAIRDNPVVYQQYKSRGRKRVFGSRDEAERWATDLDEGGRKRLALRTAGPMDPSEADAYLIERRTGSAEVGL